MILTFLIAALTSAAPTCTLTGKLELTNNGKPLSDPENHAVVTVESVPGQATTESRPMQTLLQTNITFKPALMVVVKGDSIVFTNEDKDEHSVFSLGPPEFALPASRRGVTGTQTFKVPGWSKVECKIHKKMRADILVVENPFFAIVGPDGSWSIPNLPAGREYEVVAREPNGAATRARSRKCVSETNVLLPLLNQVTKKPRRDYDGIFQPG